MDDIFEILDTIYLIKNICLYIIQTIIYIYSILYKNMFNIIKKKCIFIKKNMLDI